MLDRLREVEQSLLGRVAATEAQLAEASKHTHASSELLGELTELRDTRQRE